MPRNLIFFFSFYNFRVNMYYLSHFQLLFTKIKMTFPGNKVKVTHGQNTHFAWNIFFSSLFLLYSSSKKNCHQMNVNNLKKTMKTDNKQQDQLQSSVRLVQFNLAVQPPLVRNCDVTSPNITASKQWNCLLFSASLHQVSSKLLQNSRLLFFFSLLFYTLYLLLSSNCKSRRGRR